MGERDVTLLGRLVVDGGVALAEGAAADILAREADREALDQQGGEGQMLGGGPVDALAALDRGLAGGDDALEARRALQAGGRVGHFAAALAQQLPRPRRAAALVLDRRRVKAVPSALQPVHLVRLVRRRDLVRGLELALE